MKIEAICVCEGYGDFLRYTLPQMQIAFDEVVVLTTKADEETLRVCRKNLNPTLIVDYIQRGGRFGKGRAINKALEHFLWDGWVAVIDADIWVPSTFGRELRNWIRPAMSRYLIGAQRRIVSGFAQFCDFSSSLPARIAREWRPDEPLERCVTRDMWPVPLGYFQLWNRDASNVYRYQEGHTHQEVEDVLFARRWSVLDRHIICDQYLYHLQTEGHFFMQDWNGRKQPRFGPEV